MALYPLCHHGEAPTQAVQHAAEVIEQTSPSEVQKREWLSYLVIFGKLAYPHLDVRHMIELSKLRGTPGYVEIMEEGALEQTRRLVLQTIEYRFGDTVQSEFARLVQQLENRNVLEELNRLAVTSATVAEFRRAVSATEGVPSKKPSRRKKS